MFYIKLDDNMDLVITVREPIYRGDNLNQKIRYLLPFKVEDIDILTAYVYLNYIRADGTPDVVPLERLEDRYNESYYQFTFPVEHKFTRYAGEICTWLQIYTGDPSNPITAKSGECVIRVQDSKDIDDYIGDTVLTAIYKLHKEVDDKADSHIYDKTTGELQLTSDGEPIGDVVVIKGGGSDDEGEDWSDMEDGDGTDSGDDTGSGDNTGGDNTGTGGNDNTGGSGSGGNSDSDFAPDWEPM